MEKCQIKSDSILINFKDSQATLKLRKEMIHIRVWVGQNSLIIIFKWNSDKPQHFTADYINICGAADVIAWSIRLSFTEDHKTTAQEWYIHFIVLPGLSNE